MKFCRMIAVAAIALAMTSAGQSVAANSGQASTPTKSTAPTAAQAGAPADTQVLVELKQSLNTKKVHVGDPVKATVTQDVLIHGQIAIARGSKLFGRVTETKVRSDNDKESFLGLVFDKMVLKGGQEIQFNGTIAALAAPPRLIMDEPESMLSPGSMVRDQVGGPQQAPATVGSSRGKASPSNDTPLNPADSAIGSAARIARDTDHPGDTKSGAGLLSAGSHGVLGLPGLTLRTEPAGGHGSVISSVNHNVVLQSGTQMLVQVTIPIRSQ